MFDQMHRIAMPDLGQAFDTRQISLAFQPKVHLAGRRVIGAEALLRWRHPEHGTLPPAVLIGHLERTRQTGVVTRFILNEAIQTCNIWMRAGKLYGVSVNLSLSDLADSGLVDAVGAALGRTQVPPERLTLELPASVNYLGPDRRTGQATARQHERRRDRPTSKAWSTLMHTIGRLEKLGVRIALQSGGDALDLESWSAHRLIDEIKISGPAVRALALPGGTPHAHVTPSRLRAALDEGIEVVAVGVETAAVLKTIERLGFTSAQGRLFGPPVGAVSLLDWNTGDIANILDSAHASDPIDDALPAFPLPRRTPLN